MFSLFKTKYVKGRHFVVKNYRFVYFSQKRKQTNVLTSTDLTKEKKNFASYICVTIFRTQLLICFKNWIFPAQLILHLILTLFRCSHRRCSVKKGVLKSFANFIGKCLWWSLFLIKLQTFSLIKKILQHRCFPVRPPKSLRTTISRNIYKRLLLSFSLLIILLCKIWFRQDSARDFSGFFIIE